MWPGGSPSAVVNGAAGLVVAALVILGLYEGRDLLIPLAIAAILSFILFPLVRRLNNWGFPKGLAVALVMSALVGALLGSLTLAGREVGHLLEEVPRHESNLREKARYVYSFVGGTGVWQRAVDTLRRVEQEVRDPETESKPLKIEVAPDQPLARLVEYTRSTLPSLLTAALALVITLFMLLQYEELRDRALRLMGASEIGRSTQALDEAGSDLAHFLLLQAGLNASFGVVVGIALWVVGIPTPGLWGTLAALMRFVPYIGSPLAAMLPLALAAMIDTEWGMLIETAVVFLAGDVIVGQFVEPLLFGSYTRLSSIAVVLCAAFWTFLWGPVGLILAVPLTLTIVIIGQHIPHLEFLSVCLGNEPVLKPHEKVYRQLLAGEASEAAKDADLGLDERDYVRYLDEVIVPALRIASDDHRRAVLGKEQLDRLKDSMTEYIVHIRELLDFTSEQRDAQRPPSAEVTPAGKVATAVVIAGRGPIDQAAAELVAEAIRFNVGIPAQCPSPGGLTGISAASDAMRDAPPDIVVLISVGEITAAQLNLLLGRVKRVFNRTAILIGYWANPMELFDYGQDDKLIVADNVDSVLRNAGRIAIETTMTPNRPPPLKLV
jgi:predicted PurR-regulated permease PerM